MKMNHKYELMAIISSRITDGEITKRIKGLKELLGSEVVFEELWGMRSFAFAISKQDKGYYAVWNFMANADLVQDLEKHLKLYPDLLRFLLVRVPDEYKPMTLEKIEAGLEELRKQKAEKRGGRAGNTPQRPAGDLRPDMKAPTAAPIPPQTVTQKAEAPIAAAKPAAEAEASPEVTPEDKEKKARAFDKKLEDILSNDDLGL
jgi:small subunit ribosomal protein S6